MVKWKDNKPYAQQPDDILNRIVAEYSGYQVKRYDEWHDQSGMYQLYAPDGDKVGDAEKYGDYAWGNVPTFAEKIENALALINGLLVGIIIRPNGDMDVIVDKIVSSFTKLGDDVESSQKGIPRFICLAWLAWKEQP